MPNATSFVGLAPEASFFTPFVVGADDANTYLCRGPQAPVAPGLGLAALGQRTDIPIASIARVLNVGGTTVYTLQSAQGGPSANLISVAVSQSTDLVAGHIRLTVTSSATPGVADVIDNLPTASAPTGYSITTVPPSPNGQPYWAGSLVFFAGATVPIPQTVQATGGTTVSTYRSSTIANVQSGQELAAQYVFAQLAAKIAAPVPTSAIVTLPGPFVLANPQVPFLIGPVTCLGLLYPGATRPHGLPPGGSSGDSNPIAGNRTRLAALGVMAAWFGGFLPAMADLATSPFTLYATALEGVLPDGAGWTATSLAAAQSATPAPPLPFLPRSRPRSRRRSGSCR